MTAAAVGIPAMIEGHITPGGCVMTERALPGIMTGWCRMATGAVRVTGVVEGYIAP